MKITTIVAQFKRELWENKVGFLWAPVVFCCLLFAASIWVVTEKTLTFSDLKTSVDPDDQGMMALMALAYQVVSCVTYMMSFAIVIAVYAHSTLFADRKSREILFWRSMPVGESLNVFSKLAMICIMAPLIIFILNLLGTILFILFLTVLNPEFSQFAEAVKTLSASVELLGSSFIVVLLILPLVSWGLFCSAYARRSPVTISISVPLVFWIVDALAQRYLGLNLFFKDALTAYTQLTRTSFKKMIGDSGRSLADIDLLSSIDLQVTSLALLFSVLMIGAAIWLRNNRYEI